METILAFGLGGTELMIICGVIVLIFGASKIPQLMRGMGQGINEFKKGLKEGDSEAAQEKKIEEKTEGSQGEEKTS